ncbi:MAG: carboxymuconolactone decarboxylase family protein [Gemmatimonadaceae bacterium]
MKSRFNFAKTTPGLYEAMDYVDQYIAECGLERSLVCLVQLRISQINGCAYCIDMHWKDLRALGEEEQRLYSLNAWRESGFDTERERAALAWAEAVTQLHEGQVSDSAYAEARAALGETDVAKLTLVTSQMNAWNRLSIASRLVAGTYEPATSVTLSA